jgi:hypothetical protein
MKKSLKPLLFFAILMFLPLACNLGVKAPPDDAAATLNPLYTAAAQTLEAMSTQAEVTPGNVVATSTPIIGNAPTSTPILAFASSTPYLYLSPVPVKRCDAATFIKDVTIPDGTIISPGTDFRKTWRVKNTGTCTWTSSYALVFISGDGMNTPAYVNLSGNVNPGESVDLTLNLVAPTKKGHYRGNWKLRNTSGVVFGIGAQADTAFWADIEVIGPEFVAYDFVSSACNADWESNTGTLPCPGIEDDDDGYALMLSNPRMEDGTKGKQPGLLTTPRHTKNGYIQGKYPAFKVQQGDHFLTKVNCQFKANTCDVLFRLEYQIGNGKIKTLKEWHEVYEGNYYSVDLDLSSLAGENVKFYLTVSANDSKGKDQALWLAPRILRQGTPSPTPTATITATATPTFTATATETPTATP